MPIGRGGEAEPSVLWRRSVARDVVVLQASGDGILTYAFRSGGYGLGVRVTFSKDVERRVSTWEAIRGKRTLVPGTDERLRRGQIPHDLAQLVVEATLGIKHGFWGGVAVGATFRSTGRRATRPGRAWIAAHREELRKVEHLADARVAEWKAGERTVTAVALDAVAKRWERLPRGQRLTIEWPTLRILEPAEG